MKRNALVTGASRGIGRAIADALKDAGYNVLTPSRDELDMSDPASAEKYISGLSCSVDILVNNAGINILGGIEEVSQTEINDMINVNLLGPMSLIKAVTPKMKENKFGRIVNISSIWGVRSKERRLMYSMAKFGINGVTHSLARELGAYNILVNSVAPGYVNTEMTIKNVPQADKERIQKEIPLGRFAEPAEIASVVRFLVSGDNTYITGQTIVADGGFLA